MQLGYFYIRSVSSVETLSRQLLLHTMTILTTVIALYVLNVVNLWQVKPSAEWKTKVFVMTAFWRITLKHVLVVRNPLKVRKGTSSTITTIIIEIALHATAVRNRWLARNSDFAMIPNVSVWSVRKTTPSLMYHYILSAVDQIKKKFQFIKLTRD